MNSNVQRQGELEKIIEQYDVISFDIFDTLIMRRTLEPEDVFEIVANKTGIEDFAQNRQRAILQNPVANPTIFEVYRQYSQQTGISQDAATRLMKCELDIEKKVLITRKSMLEIFKYAKKIGKKVYLITDMYLPSCILETILHGLEIAGYDKLFVSCDYRALKSENLFEIYRSELETTENGKNLKLLHIGDNPKSDIECAVKYGIDTVKIDSAYTLLKSSCYNSLLKKIEMETGNAECLMHKNLLGYFISEMFNNPFLKNGMKRIRLADVVRLMISPLVYCMMGDIEETVRENGFDMVLFSARDGYLFHRLYKKTGKRDGEYFYISRKALVNVDVDTDDKLYWLLQLNYDFSGNELLKRIFGIDGIEIPLFEDGKEVIDWLEKNPKIKEVLREKAVERKQNYLRYIRSMNIREKKFLLVDLVASGTCQLYLEKLLGQTVDGYYMCKLRTTEHDKEMLNSYSLFEPVDISDKRYGFYKIYYLFEYILSAYEPSLNHFDDNGRPVLDEESRSLAEIEELKNLHDVIERYYEEINALNEGAHTKTDAYKRCADYVDLWIKEMIGQKIGFENDCSVVLKDDWLQTKHLMAAVKEKGDFFFESEMRSSILNWYTFRPEGKILEVGADSVSLTRMFCRKLSQVTTVPRDEDAAAVIAEGCRKYGNLTLVQSDGMETIIKNSEKTGDRYDYIYLSGQSAVDCTYGIDFEIIVKKLLKLDGNLLIAVENISGSRYMCGYPQEKNCVGKKALLDMLDCEEIKNKKFYYPYPDYRFAQEIYTDLYQPTGNIKDRVLYYYPQKGMLFQNEYDFIQDKIEKGYANDYCNSFLIECTKDGILDDALYIAVSTDRGARHSFATLILRNESGEKIVKKRALYQEGVSYLKKSYDNIKELERRGVSVVEHVWKDNELVMPFIEAPKFSEYLAVVAKKGKLLAALRKLREVIQKSSDVVLIDNRECLKKAYIDMIPLNCFYVDDELFFFDQEFTRENCEIDYIMFRALFYFYNMFPKMENVIPLETVKKEMGLGERWEAYHRQEEEFIWENRQHAINKEFYNWLEAGTCREIFRCGNSSIILGNGFDNAERLANDTWSWAIEKSATLLIRNMGCSQSVTVEMELLAPPNREKQDILLLLENGSGEIVEKQNLYLCQDFVGHRMELKLEKDECVRIYFRMQGEFGCTEHDDRKFAFQLRNPKIS